MSKKRTHFICRGCKKPFPNPNSRKAHCSLSCAVWHKIDKRGPADCWEWQGARTWFGYGSLRYEGVHYYAHKVAYADAKGEPFPDGLEGCHSCDNPPCCNPAHIFPGTHAENMKDAVAKGRNARGAKSSLARHTAETVVALRKDYAVGGLTFAELGARYGMSAENARHISLRHSWRHI